MLKKYIGDKTFYKTILTFAIPIIMQSIITSFVSMLDNIMIGSEGAIAISSVGISNQLIMVFYAQILGISSGASIFGTQFFGKGDIEGVRNSFRFRFVSMTVITALFISVFLLFGTDFIKIYLQSDNNSPEDVAEMLKLGKSYLNIMLIGLIPFAYSQCYSGTLRECGNTILPLISGIVAVLTNMVFNYLLIFGKFGFPRLGIQGAAIATVISRFVELSILVIVSRANRKKNVFVVGLWRTVKVPARLFISMVKKCLPLMANEILWSLNGVVISQAYSTRGIDAVAANNITQTYFSVFTVGFGAVGAAMGLILGQQIGRGDKKENIKDSDRKLLAFSIFVSVVTAALFFACSYIIPSFYNVSADVKLLVKNLIQVCAALMPLEAIMQGLYYTIRSGGKTLVILVVDSIFYSCISMPIALIISNFTDISIIYMYAICQGLLLIKCIISYIYVRRDTWINSVVSEELC